jgi:arginyl-tRNA synthetase
VITEIGWLDDIIKTITAILALSGFSVPAIIKTVKTLKKKKEERLEIVKNEIRILEAKIDNLTQVISIYINANGTNDKLKQQLNRILEKNKRRR